MAQPGQPDCPGEQAFDPSHQRLAAEQPRRTFLSPQGAPRAQGCRPADPRAREHPGRPQPGSLPGHVGDRVVRVGWQVTRDCRGHAGSTENDGQPRTKTRSDRGRQGCHPDHPGRLEGQRAGLDQQRPRVRHQGQDETVVQPGDRGQDHRGSGGRDDSGLLAEDHQTARSGRAGRLDDHHHATGEPARPVAAVQVRPG